MYPWLYEINPFGHIDINQFNAAVWKEWELAEELEWKPSDVLPNQLKNQYWNVHWYNGTCRLEGQVYLGA